MKINGNENAYYACKRLNIYSETIMERFIQKINLKRQQSFKLNSTMNSVENNRTINRFNNLKINITTLPNEIIIKQ